MIQGNIKKGKKEGIWTRSKLGRLHRIFNITKYVCFEELRIQLKFVISFMRLSSVVGAINLIKEIPFFPNSFLNSFSSLTSISKNAPLVVKSTSEINLAIQSCLNAQKEWAILDSS